MHVTVKLHNPKHVRIIRNIRNSYESTHKSLMHFIILSYKTPKHRIVQTRTLRSLYSTLSIIQLSLNRACMLHVQYINFYTVLLTSFVNRSDH